jgi:hypothetical protein
MQRSALAALSCVLMVGCQSGPSQPTNSSVSPLTAAIALEGDLNFGDTPVRTVAEKTIRIVNLGTGPLHVTGLTSPGGGGLCQIPAEVEVCGSLSASWTQGSIAPSQWRDITIRFDTAHGDNVSGMVTVNSNATSGTSSIAISGRSVR